MIVFIQPQDLAYLCLGLLGIAVVAACFIKLLDWLNKYNIDI